MSRKEFHDEAIVNQIAEHYREILRLIGEDPSREGLVKTPIRAAKAIIDITAGYRQDAVEVAKKAVFEHAGSSIVIVKDIEFSRTLAFKSNEDTDSIVLEPTFVEQTLNLFL